MLAIDDHTVSSLAPRRELVDTIIDVLHHPRKDSERPEGEMILGQVAKGFVLKSLSLLVEDSEDTA